MNPCTVKAAHPATSVTIGRMMGLETAAGMLGGQRHLADALGIEPRSLRSKLVADRGVSDADLRFAARALEDRAARLVDHARKLRELVV